MPAPSALPIDQTPLSAQRLRELIREARGGFPPDHTARALRMLRPEIVEDDADEVAVMLADLIASARERLRDAGIEPHHNERRPPEKLPKREREYVANLATLCSWLAIAMNETAQFAEALELGHEGLAWCRAAGDHAGEAAVWRIMSGAHQGMGELQMEETATRRGVEAARHSDEPQSLVQALEALASLLVVRQRLDEAEQANEEALAVLRDRLEERGSLYVGILVNRARVLMMRTRYAESIKVLREALRWADPEAIPMDRAAAMAHLGSVYLRLEQYRQSIECQHEVVRLGARLGSDELRGWGYYRLAEAHLRLNELEKAEDALDRAAECGIERRRSLAMMIAAKRAQLYTEREEFDRAEENCRMIVREVGDRPFPDVLMFAHKQLAEVAERRGRDTDAAGQYRRAIEVSDNYFPQRTPALSVCLAGVLHRLGRDEEVSAMVNAIDGSDALNPTEQVRVLQLRAAIAERRGEFQAALNCEREAFAKERLLLERRAEESLRNARIVAETDLLEHEADMERERRRRLEHELAEAIVELSDRKRMAETVELRLRKALERAGLDEERATARVLRETLSDLRAGSQSQESPLRYLSGVDEDFYRRLRARCPDLTSKQERLCALLRAGLASREIANLMGLEAEGLKAQRKRLRKKLGLNPEDRLEVVLGEM